MAIPTTTTRVPTVTLKSTRQPKSRIRLHEASGGFATSQMPSDDLRGRFQRTSKCFKRFQRTQIDSRGFRRLREASET
ncbi:hypothetical protein Hamer_G009381 [Homarus americanus]|uniref:Uncharacterized protein n=1 Tax=Homarus americanus TaxID=6706 RepID=A0A8J5MJF5_HOMAM|nr:hypothetical protein Hamer_G009381 [Homarus americanus]